MPDTPEQQILRIAQHLRAIPDDMARVAEAQRLFGRAWREMWPFVWVAEERPRRAREDA